MFQYEQKCILSLSLVLQRRSSIVQLVKTRPDEYQYRC